MTPLISNRRSLGKLFCISSNLCNRGSETDHRSGSGIGLATVRKIVRLSGGSTFWVEFPYEENASIELRRKEELSSELTPGKVTLEMV